MFTNTQPKLSVLAVCFLAMAASLPAANLVTNPGFETGNLTGWVTWGSTITKSTEQERGGSYSCLNTARTADWQGCVQDLTGKLTVGTTYRISAWVRLRNVASDRVLLLIKASYAGTDHYFSSEDPLVSNDAWTPLVLYYTHGGTGLINTFFYVAGPAPGVEFFVDDVTVETTYEPQAVTVDLSVSHGAVTQRGSGFLFGLAANDPATNYYESIKPKLQRDRAALNGAANWGPNTGFSSPAFMNRVQQAGAKHQVLISDAYCWERNNHNTWGWPGDPAHDGKGPYDLLDQTIDELMAAAQTNNYQVEWDIWNEPDLSLFWGRGQAQFFETWNHAYRRIRSNDPNAVIVGPSVTAYDRYTGGSYLTNFLSYAHSNNVLPDVVSWHQLGMRKSINAEVQAVRAFMASNGMPGRPIDLNEYIGDTEWSHPGIHIWYLAGLERAGVRRAAHAVWDEVSGDPSSGGIFAGRLAHLLTRDTHQPRAVWHVYKAYAELEGELKQLSPGIQIDGLAASDTNGTLRIILGNDSADTNHVNLTISQLAALPYHNPNSTVLLTVRRIPNTGTAALAAPIYVTNQLITLSSNSLMVSLVFNPAEVLLLTMVQPPRLQVVNQTRAVVAQLGDLFPDAGTAGAGSRSWPGNNGLNTNNNVGPNVPNAAGLSATAGTASWRVGWVQGSDWNAAGWGNPGAATWTMGGWIWPNDASALSPTVTGSAQGYSWGGTHDVGWVNHVGFETIGSVMRVRNNAGSFPLLEWKAPEAGIYSATFTLGADWSSWPNDRTGFGIWSTRQSAYVGDTAVMLNWAPPSTPLARPAAPGAGGPYLITASNLSLAAGDRLFFVARTLGDTTQSSYEFQRVTIEQVNPTHALMIRGTPGQHYRVEYADALAPPMTWKLLADIPALPASSITLAVPSQAGPATRFYRAALIP